MVSVLLDQDSEHLPLDHLPDYLVLVIVVAKPEYFWDATLVELLQHPYFGVELFKFLHASRHVVANAGC